MYETYRLLLLNIHWQLELKIEILLHVLYTGWDFFAPSHFFTSNVASVFNVDI